MLGNKRCEITYCINGNEPLQKGEAELIAYWLQDIGLDVKIQAIEYATLSKMMRKGDFNAVHIPLFLELCQKHVAFQSHQLYA